MDTQNIITIINTVGFPIACCVALFLQQNKNTAQYQQSINTMQKALENNTLALKEISIKLNVKEGEK